MGNLVMSKKAMYLNIEKPYFLMKKTERLFCVVGRVGLVGPVGLVGQGEEKGVSNSKECAI